MHPFALGITGRASRDGSIATVSGVTLDAASAMKTEQRAGGRGLIGFEATTPTAAAPFTVTLGVQQGAWTYTASNGVIVASAIKADGAAHHLVPSHYTARRDAARCRGTLAGRAAERFEPRQFTRGGAVADYRDLLIYRSALNADEIAALERGKLLQASLEVYSPLTDLTAHSGGAVKHLAQSLTSAKVGTASVQYMEK